MNMPGPSSVDFYGYGYVKQSNGDYNYKGATEHDLLLMRKHSSEKVQIKAAGGVRTLDGLLKVMDMGITRLGATATATIIEDAKKRLGLEATEVINSTVGY
jgi:deoxyribose-phosphate aldolase